MSTVYLDFESETSVPSTSAYPRVGVRRHYQTDLMQGPSVRLDRVEGFTSLPGTSGPSSREETVREGPGGSPCHLGEIVDVIVVKVPSLGTGVGVSPSTHVPRRATRFFYS